MKTSLTLLRTSFLFGVIGLLASCASQQTYESRQVHQVYTQPASYYVQQANDSQGSAKEVGLVQASAAYFYYNQPEQARQTLYKVKMRQLPAAAYVQYQLLTAKLAIHDNDPARAIDILNMVSQNPNLTSQMNIELLQLKASAQQQSEQIEPALITRLSIAPLLTEQHAIEQNQELIWQTLNILPRTTLQQLTNQPNTEQPNLQGWAALALITREYAGDTAQLLQYIRYWQTQYADHPANTILSKNVSSLASQSNTVQQVAVLLPLQGPLAQQSEAVLNGFMAAYYHAKSMRHPVPTIKVYDTSATEDIVQQYKDAVHDGADFVVGPLTKGNVQILKSKGDISVPTLALNYATDDSAGPSDFYQFALSPESEAKDAAVQALQYSHNNAITITPAGQWGANIANAFTAEWQALDGQVVNSLAYPPNQGLKDVVSELLNINQSNWRKIKLQRVLGQQLKFSARRRKDFDMFFLNALPAQAREIVPLLRFYYAGNVPIYATSQVYSGVPNAQGDKDLDGVQFTIMPWALNPSKSGQALQKQFSRNWPNSFKQFNLLYAFGADSYRLVSGINQIKVFPTIGLQGHTGRLFLTPSGRIRRQLEWARFEKGIPQLIAKQNDVIAPLTN